MISYKELTPEEKSEIEMDMLNSFYEIIKSYLTQHVENPITIQTRFMMMNKERFEFLTIDESLINEPEKLHRELQDNINKALKPNFVVILTIKNNSLYVVIAYVS